MPPTIDEDPGRSTARRFGAAVHEAAERAGYDLRPGAGGRAALAKDVGMSASAVGRMLRGDTLPRPSQFEQIAYAVHVELRDLLVRGGVISRDSANSLPLRVRSQAISPEEAADAWGITDPVIRKFLLATISQAITMQHGQREENAG
ncbi:helix-turn-helix transcriptional regulator [Kitasatospora sp. NPDC048540]|uniref:helix-turn-helix domain-containing protein n=1 Tax=unclassified Kitasatospora TaxID=2633591 RepID=UPI00053974DE|nr:helix-turn-helix transcriptional regulator [Kitasatospora sp. MBT63]